MNYDQTLHLGGGEGELLTLEGSLDVGLEGTFGTDERHVLVVSNGVSLQLRLVRKRPSALVADVASDSKVDLVDVLLQAPRRQSKMKQ